MKIGIITFHWATNYGAVLQTFALKTSLEQLGHDVCIINYKPSIYDFNIFRCLFSRKILKLGTELLKYKKHLLLEIFRKKYLNETIRYYTTKELQNNPPSLDAYISGSDQVLNVYFTSYGEGKNSFTTAYFLDFGNHIKKIGYALSFGTMSYPEDLVTKVAPFLTDFDKISVRENSGCKIVSDITKKRAFLVPDPTLLIERVVYDKLVSIAGKLPSDILFYILRDCQSNVKRINNIFKNEGNKSIIIGEQTVMSLEKWINAINGTQFFVTNSYHGMILSLIYNVPFLVLKAHDLSSGMNDRFYTLLNILGLENRIVDELSIRKIDEMKSHVIDWNTINIKIADFRKRGMDYLCLI